MFTSTAYFSSSPDDVVSPQAVYVLKMAQHLDLTIRRGVAADLFATARSSGYNSSTGTVSSSSSVAAASPRTASARPTRCGTLSCSDGTSSSAATPRVEVIRQTEPPGGAGEMQSAAPAQSRERLRSPVGDPRDSDFDMSPTGGDHMNLTFHDAPMDRQGRSSSSMGDASDLRYTSR